MQGSPFIPGCTSVPPTEPALQGKGVARAQSWVAPIALEEDVMISKVMKGHKRSLTMGGQVAHAPWKQEESPIPSNGGDK